MEKNSSKCKEESMNRYNQRRSVVARRMMAGETDKNDLFPRPNQWMYEYISIYALFHFVGKKKSNRKQRTRHATQTSTALVSWEFRSDNRSISRESCLHFYHSRRTLKIDTSHKTEE